jgi:multicomponent K+:H+ antiporter subunit D
MVLDAAYESSQASLIWLFVLVTSLMMTIAFANAGSIVFWKTEGRTTGPTSATAPLSPIIVVALLVSATALLSVFASPTVEAFRATAEQSLAPADYINAVLGSENVIPSTGH